MVEFRLNRKSSANELSLAMNKAAVMARHYAILARAASVASASVSTPMAYTALSERYAKHEEAMHTMFRMAVNRQAIKLYVSMADGVAGMSEIFKNGTNGILNNTEKYLISSRIENAREEVRRSRSALRNKPPIKTPWERAMEGAELRWQGVANSNKKKQVSSYGATTKDHQTKAPDVIGFRKAKAVPLGIMAMYRMISDMYPGAIQNNTPSLREMSNGGRCWSLPEARGALSSVLHYMGYKDILRSSDSIPIPCDYRPPVWMRLACPFVGVPLMLVPQYAIDGLQIMKVFGLGWVEARRSGRVLMAKHTKASELHYCEWWAATSVGLENAIVAGAIHQKDAIEAATKKIVAAVSEAL